MNLHYALECGTIDIWNSMRVKVVSSFSHCVLFNWLYKIYMNVYCSLAVQGERRSYLNYQSKCSPLIFEYFNTFIQSVFLWFIKKTNKQKITNLKRSLLSVILKTTWKYACVILNVKIQFKDLLQTTLFWYKHCLDKEVSIYASYL